MKKLLLACAILATALTTRATTYYVSNAGSDSNAGTSTSAPWSTAAKVNGASLTAGDIVSFQDGGIWREQLVPQSGNSTSNITYNAYGNGNKPLFLGSINASVSSMWTSLGSNQWATANGSLPIDVGSLNFNNPSYVDNPSFTVDTSGWSLWANSAHSAAASFSRTTTAGAYDSGPAGCAIVVANKGTAVGDVIFVHTNLSISNGKVYQLRIRAKASTAFTLPAPSMFKQTTPWTLYGSGTPSWSGGGSVTTSWTTFTANLTSNTSANDVELSFGLGNAVPNGATLYLDDITFSEITDNPSLITNPSFTTDLTSWILSDVGTAVATISRSTSIYDSIPASAAVAVSNKGRYHQMYNYIRRI